MIRPLFLYLIFHIVVTSTTIHAQQPPAEAGMGTKLQYETGTIKIGSNLATLTLPPSLRFLNSEQTQFVVEKLWGNPPGNSYLGMVVPSNKEVDAEDCVAAIITFDDTGYVSDSDAASINYSELLATMQGAEKEANAERAKMGFPAVHLVGWATAPHYDGTNKKLYWAKEIEFGGDPEHTLNYCIRALGRRGVLEVNIVGTMQQLPQAQQLSPQILAALEFDPGSRYSDFNSSTDQVAGYGIAALVAGGVAAKAGLFKGLLVALLAAKKFLIIGGIALLAGIAKLFSAFRKPKQ